ncbi:geranylgeranyl transferas-like protein type i beta subunit [Elsinoe ampelina]|uniref:Geranylgeranyl transferas-like protein type i beta subunit n=1 Tax=Elsinoe ampelina TaxID=302913 RepID=A0A6A6G993_9PEZI|nr:geranylgeranyl transferas-like protein type i beta subunit [Elsinoe ampelina]
MSAPQVTAASHVSMNDTPQLDGKRHTKYFLRCLKTYLPQPYTSNDSNRLSLAFFIVAALDLLDTLESNTSPQERADYLDWIYQNQHPHGGFRGFPGSDFGERRNDENAQWDPANLPATYFALCLLLILNDDFSRLERDKCLDWIPQLQREDGSFGETIVAGNIQGGKDSRFGYCASGIRYMLAGHPQQGQGHARDIKVDQLVECICSAESYDGGISDSPFHEPHAGYTYCGLGALSFLGRLSTSGHSGTKPTGPSSPNSTIQWLVSRQTATITEDDSFDTRQDETDTPETCHDAHTFLSPSQLATETGKLSFASRPTRSFALDWVGMNGRPNKIADTCYAFWVGGALHLLDAGHLLEKERLRKWLLERTAHPALGGFGKHAGELPDVYHSYLGLAALSLIGDESIQKLDATLCISTRAKQRLGPLWEKWGVAGRQ